MSIQTSDLYIRPSIPTDFSRLAEICELTASPSLLTIPDKSIIPSIYCTPYLVLPSGISFVLSLPPPSPGCLVEPVPEHPQGLAVGYIIGTLNTRRFVKEYREIYIPSLKESGKHGPPSSDAQEQKRYIEALRVPEENRWIYSTLWAPEVMETKLLDEELGLSAHLHVDILPEHQGQGWGVGLLEKFEAAVKDGILNGERLRGYHLGMDEKNDRAGKWYGRMGLTDLSKVVGRGRWMGKWLDGSNGGNLDGEVVERQE